MNSKIIGLTFLFLISALAHADYTETVTCNGTNQNGLIVTNCPVPLGAHDSISGIVSISSQSINNLSGVTIPCINMSPYFENYELNYAQSSISVWGGCNGTFVVNITSAPVIDYKYGPLKSYKDTDSGDSPCPQGYKTVSCNWDGQCTNKDRYDTGCHAKAKRDEKCSVQSYCVSN